MRVAFWILIGNVGRRLTDWSTRHLETRHLVDQVKEKLECRRNPRIVSAIALSAVGVVKQIGSAPSSKSIAVSRLPLDLEKN